MSGINAAWLAGRLDELAAMVHPQITMAVPGFTATACGREAFLNGFREFLESSKIHEYHEQGAHVDVVGNTGVVTFRYGIVYERAGERYRAQGRDLWVFENIGEAWIAVWRAMLDMQESAVAIA